MKFVFTGNTNTGMVRTANQDSYYYDEDGRFFIVADGMGGHAGGEKASSIATEKIKFCLNEYWNNTQTDNEKLIQDAFEQANKGILNDQHQNPERSDMGTTAVILMYRNNQYFYGNVGDSRLYNFRDGKLTQITEDQTWVARALKIGDLTKKQAKNHPWRHVLSQCLGRKELNVKNLEIDEIKDVQINDRFLLCSDGLTEEVDDSIIESALVNYATPEEVTSNLIEEALESGGSDNVTVIVIDVKE